MGAPSSPYVMLKALSSDGSGSLIVTVTFNGAWVNGHPYTSCRVQNTSDQLCHVVLTTPKGNIGNPTVAAGFDQTFPQASLNGWSLGDGAAINNVSWS